MEETPKNIERIIVPVEGMTCASCVARVEKAIQKVDGVKNVSVNLASEKALIEYEKGKINLNEISKVVREAGYKVNLNSVSSDKVKPRLPDSEQNTKKEFLLAVVFTIPILFFNMGYMWIDFENLWGLNLENMNKLLLILTTPVIFISGRRFFKYFFLNLKHFSADMNTLIAVGTGSAYLYSAAVTLFPNLILGKGQLPHVYFDTAAVIITLILFGKRLETRAKSKTGSAIKKLIELKPEFAIVKRDGIEQKIPIDQIKIGDTIIVKPGSNIPTDGIIEIGSSLIDESMITGESLPVVKTAGDKVVGGTINKSGYLEFKVSAVGDNSLLGQIIKMIEEAQGSKAPIQSLADKVASVFVPIVILISILTLITWILLGSPFNLALINFVAVLIIACPCALGLATPTAIIVGIGKAAQLGILVKDGESLEKANQLTTIIFDKTGTLTEGKPTLSKIITKDVPEDHLLQIAASIENKSNHPYAESIVSYTRKKNLTISESKVINEELGRGIVGMVNSNEVALGSISFMQELKTKIDQWVEDVQKELNHLGSTVFVAVNREVKAALIFEDQIKEGTFETVRQLKEMNFKVGMLTGDNHQNAERIARELGFDFFEANVLPHQKVSIIKKYQQQNEIVGMVGDGINDSPALAQSDVGIAVGSGTDIAIESSSIVILRENLNAIVSSIKLSRRTIKTIKQNLFWAFFYNVVCIPLAAFGLLNPMLAALAMSLSSVSVVSNSLRLKNFKANN